MFIEILFSQSCPQSESCGRPCRSASAAAGPRGESPGCSLEPPCPAGLVPRRHCSRLCFAFNTVHQIAQWVSDRFSGELCSHGENRPVHQGWQQIRGLEQFGDLSLASSRVQLGKRLHYLSPLVPNKRETESSTLCPFPGAAMASDREQGGRV